MRVETFGQEKTNHEEESLSESVEYKIGDTYWLNGHPYTVNGVCEGHWLVKDDLTEPFYTYKVPGDHTMYYINHPLLGIGSTFLKLSVRQGLPESRI